MKHLCVSVRALVEHSLRSGDLIQEFSQSIHPVEAIRVHQKIQGSRPAGYLSEVAVSHQLKRNHILLEVRGRIDGVLEDAERLLVEEIKTTQSNPSGDSQVHWGQAKVYSYIYAVERGFEIVDTQLTYYVVKSGQTVEFLRRHTREQLESFFDEVVLRYLEWQESLDKWYGDRDESIREGVFPFGSYRPGQREMAIAVFRSIRDEQQLLVQAATGIGKTMAALFPALKALTQGLTQKIFYLTARTTGKLAAEKALIELARMGIRLKSLTITAKQKICFNTEKECNAEECLYARGFYDRLKNAIAELLEHDLITREVVEVIAEKHRVCPFQLALECSLWVDCIVCDYNYLFDPRVNLRRIFRDLTKHYILIVDEAHNLPDRARDMFSAELGKQSFLDLKKAFKGFPKLSSSLVKVNREFNRLRRQYGQRENPTAARQPPESLYPQLRNFLKSAESVLLGDDTRELAERSSLLDLYFQTGSFLRVAEQYDSSYVSCYQLFGKDLKVRLLCLEPSKQLREVLRESRSAIFFSATLTPLGYFQSLLGCSPQAHQIRLPSPFPRDNLCLAVADRVSTRYRERDSTKHDVARLLETFVSQRAGNYLIFFPSYQYMDLILESLTALTTNHETIVQTPGMTEAERTEFVARFERERSDWLIGFAVMGGVFGEGIDLAGEHLTGAAILGVGLPGLCLERDLIRKHYDGKGLSGFDYAYRFPGMNRVLQAAGRVIRSDADRGTVLLIDDRYSRQSYKILFPDEWQPSWIRGELELSSELQRFWAVETTLHS